MKNILKSLAGFQSEVPIIFKDTEGYGYTYADMPQISVIIQPLLTKYSLCYTQTMSVLDGKNILNTILYHSDSGESISSSMIIDESVELAKMNKYQVLGSAITYYRRYSLSAILGLITDKDNDAQGEQKKTSAPEAPKTLSWLNEKTREGVETPQWRNVVEAIKDKRITSLKQVRGQYQVANATAQTIELLIKQNQ